MLGLHDVFYVSQLKKFVPKYSLHLDLEIFELKSYLTFQPKPAQAIDQGVNKLKSKEIPIVKMIWEGSPNEETTWELESGMMKNYPHLFSNKILNFEDEIILRGIKSNNLI